MTRNIYRIATGFILAILASAMHGTAREYANEPSDLPRMATARSISFAASLMDMGAGALILIGAVPYFPKPFRGLHARQPIQQRDLIALNAPKPGEEQ